MSPLTKIVFPVKLKWNTPQLENSLYISVVHYLVLCHSQFFFFSVVIFDRQKLDIPGVRCPVLLCPYFCHKLITEQLPAFRLHSVTGCNI